jgi:hypothetical protein
MMTVSDCGGDMRDTIEQSLCNIFKQVGAKGSFSVGGKAKKMPAHPGISIRGIGPVGLPLSKLVVDEIIRAGAARIAPFGKGQETLVDEKIRKCWEIAAESVEIANDGWSPAVQRLIDEEIAPALECGGNVRAVLYKALVYENGGRFDMHKDTEKEDRMFGTLVIQLPSIFTGGT